MQIIDGKKIAEQIKEEIKADLKEFGRPVSLGIIYAGRDPAIDNFIRIKKKFGQSLGVRVEVYNFAGDISGESLIAETRKITTRHDGLIVQLPLPKDLPIRDILNSVPAEKDVDVLSDAAFQNFIKGKSAVLPPVVGAVRRILEEGHIDPAGKKILIVGQGRLVGLPVFYWFKNLGQEPYFIDRKIVDIAPYIEKADIIISGAGSPGLIKKEMIKEGAVLIDAGTSESSGKLLGDADPGCAERAALFTPVPGGVGPVTVALLFRNLLTLAKKT